MLNKTFKVSSLDLEVGDKVYIIVEKEDFDVAPLESAKLIGHVRSVKFQVNSYIMDVEVNGTVIHVSSEDKFSVGDEIGFTISPNNIYVESITEKKEKFLLTMMELIFLKVALLARMSLIFLAQILILILQHLNQVSMLMQL